MSLLAPLFLLGAAAVILPVVFHLIRRTTRQRTPFSSLLFLPPSPPRLTQRSRLEEILLLLLRCLAIVLLALGFARPFFKDSQAVDPSAQPPRREIFLIDTSASMQRAGLWPAAVERALRRVRDANPADELALWLFDRDSRPLVTAAEWNATPAAARAGWVASRLNEAKPGWGPSHLDAALPAAAEALAEHPNPQAVGPRRIVVISDLQDGTQLARLQGFEWPKGIDVAVESLKPRHPGNAGLQWIPDSPELGAATQGVVRVRVVNAPESTVGRFEVGWADPSGADFLGRAEEVQVAPGRSRVVTLPVPVNAAGNPSRIRLRGDDEPFDNQIHVVPPRSTSLRALYFGTEVADDPQKPYFFLRRALPGAGPFSVTLTRARPDDALDPAALREARLFFVTDTLNPEVATALREQVRTGKTLVLAPRSAAALASAAPLLGIDQLPGEEGAPRAYAMMGRLDLQHPLLAPFTDARFGDFTRIHFWKYRKFDPAGVPDSRVVAHFDNGDPALLEALVGAGRIILLASGWHSEDSQLALSTKFVPLLFSVLELGGLVADANVRAYSVGDPLPLTTPAAAAGAEVRLPDGSKAAIPAGSTTFAGTTLPGVYEMGAAGPEVGRLAVNLDPAESRTSPLPLETLESLGIPLRAGPAAPALSETRQMTLAAEEAESRQKLWRWLIVATLVVLLMESALAGWKSRRQTATSEALA